MKENTTKPGYFGTGKQLVPLTFMMLALCGISFYLGCAFSSTPSEQVLVESVQTETSVAETTDCIPIFKHVDFTPCNITLQDMTPCTDPKVGFWDHWSWWWFLHLLMLLLCFLQFWGVICSSSLGNLEGVTEWVEMTFKKDRLTSLLCFFSFV